LVIDDNTKSDIKRFEPTSYTRYRGDSEMSFNSI
jgi:hypothetical protein